jgi:RNA polymerase sigma-70 factor (ECF subfamily)
MTGEPGPYGPLAGWLADARGGSDEALGRALESCRQYLLLVANRQLGPELRAKLGPSDVVQDTFLEAKRDFHRFHGDTAEALRAWLNRILLNNLANAARSYRRTEKRELDREVPFAEVPTGLRCAGLAAPGPTPSKQAVAREENAELERVLARLPGPYREVIELRHQDQLSFEEIGRRLGRSAEAARKLWARAVEQLQAILGPADETP